MNTFVLYNASYGGFLFNQEFLLALFQRFPPSSPEGQEFFDEIFYENPSKFSNYTTELFFDDYYFVIHNDDFTEKPKKSSYIKNIKTDKVYYIPNNMSEHRANPNIIKFLFERADKITEEQFNEEYDKVLSGCYDKGKKEHLVSADGIKKFSIHNWKNSDILVSHFLTLGISGPLSNLEIKQVKAGLKWSVCEYDGSETIIVKFDYYKMITELVSELQINKIVPSTECSEMISKLIRGEISVEYLKDFERS